MKIYQKRKNGSLQCMLLEAAPVVITCDVLSIMDGQRRPIIDKIDYIMVGHLLCENQKLHFIKAELCRLLN